jgi:hypothetical protein
MKLMLHDVSTFCAHSNFMTLRKILEIFIFPSTSSFLLLMFCLLKITFLMLFKKYIHKSIIVSNINGVWSLVKMEVEGNYGSIDSFSWFVCIFLGNTMEIVIDF